MANCITKHIPNTLTCLNLFSGCLAIIAAYNADFTMASVFIVAGAIFDFFDGMSARMLKAYSPLGKELDSLADMVTFGVAPAMMIFTILRGITNCGCMSEFISEYIPYLAFVIAAFSALRLAKFNIDERQTSSFIGMPTPANALFWIGVCIGIDNGVLAFANNIWIILGLTFIFSYLLVCEIPMFSFKFKTFDWNSNKLRYIFLAIAIPTLIILGVPGISAVILLYILLSIITSLQKR